MKFLIENYSDNTHTQPMYFNSILNTYAEHSSKLYSHNNTSVYDTLDKHNPDYYITHANILRSDVIVYSIQENKKLKLILNVSGLDNNAIIKLDENLHNDNINCPIFFLNCNEKFFPKIKHRRLLYLSECFDENLTKLQTPLKYNVDRAFIVSKTYNIKETGSYHIITNIDSIKDNVDIFLSETEMSVLYSNYEEIIFCDIENYIPQSFFDAIMLGKKVYFRSENDDTISLINAILKPEQSLNYTDIDRMQDFSKLKAYIAEKHCGKNRVKTLLSQLPKE